MKQIIRHILSFFKRWFWVKPTAKDRPLKATEVIKNYWVCVKYRDQWINLRKSEVPAWNKMGRKDRRAMAQRFAVMERKGKIKFVEIDGKMTCIKNKDYESRAVNR